MTDPMTVTVAAALAGKAVEIAGEPAKKAIATLVRKVRERFRGNHDDEAVVAAVAEDPDSPERLAELQHLLQRAGTEDPAFGAELQALWNQAHTDASADNGGVVNIFNGRAETSVQTRDVHGGLTIN